MVEPRSACRLQQPTVQSVAEMRVSRSRMLNADTMRESGTMSR